MQIDRRDFLLTTAAMATATASARFAAGDEGEAARSPASLGAALRSDFPRVSSETYLNSASYHPMGVPMRAAMNRHLDYKTYGPGEGRAFFGREDQAVLKAEYGALINADADEIAFVQSTSDGENIVVAGLGLPERGGNVVLDDLHFTTSLFMYKMLEEQGLELRVVKSRDGEVPIEAMDAAIDDETRLVSMALVSNVNGYMHDVAEISALAHAHGAHVYADIIQAAGAVPVDVKAMGIDSAAASTYKWLMAERGFGLLYVRRDLQETEVPTTRYGHRQVRRFDRETLTWERRSGADRYETGNISEPLAACTLAGVRYIQALGVDNMVAHAQSLIRRLREELAPLGYSPMTPAGSTTPIVAFRVPDADDLIRRVREANIAVTVAPSERRMRVSVSVFNTDEDVDRLVSALA